MKSCIQLIAFALLSLLTAGCSLRSAEPDGRRQVPGAGLLSDQGDGFAIGGVTFQVSPMSLRVCEHRDLRMSVEVTWDAQAAGAKTVTIWVNDGSSGPKRWLSGGATGRAQTGVWIGDNSTLRMTVGEAGKTLALRRIHVTACLDASRALRDPQIAL